MDQGTVLWIVGVVFGGGILFAHVSRARTDIAKLDAIVTQMKDEMGEMRSDLRRLIRQL